MLFVFLFCLLLFAFSVSVDALAGRPTILRRCATELRELKRRIPDVTQNVVSDRRAVVFSFVLLGLAFWLLEVSVPGPR